MPKSNEQVLAERAALLAAPEVSYEQQSGDSVLAFYVGKEKYALKSDSIKKVINFQSVTSLPFVPEIFLGVLYYDGDLSPVLNSYVLFHQSINKMPKILMLLDTKFPLALATDDIIDQYEYNVNEIKPLTTRQAKTNVAVQGIFRNEITLIDTDELLTFIETLSLPDFKKE